MVEDPGRALEADVVVKVAPPTPRRSGACGRRRSDRVPAAADGAGGRSARSRGRARPASRWRRSRGSAARSRWTRCRSQANIAGYRAALIGATELGRFFPMLMTAAGNDPPGDGARARRRRGRACRRSRPRGASGRSCRASTCAPRSRSRSSRSARTFLEFDLGGDLEGAGGYAKELTPEQQARQQELMAEAIGKVDVVITTALVPGPARSDPGHRGGREADEARVGDRRSGGRGRRQLRAVRAGSDRDAPRRQDPRRR